MQPHHLPGSHRHRVAVIGAGLGGLLFANEVLERELPVELTVFEASPAAGGRARTLDVAGARLNFGPHALYRDGRLARALARWRLMPSGGTPRNSWGLVDDELERLPEGLWALMSTGLLPGLSRFRFASLMLRLSKLRAADFARQSAADFIREQSDDLHVTRTLSALARLSTYAGDLEGLSADVLVTQFKLSLNGVLYPDGGWQQIVDALVSRLQEHGVQVQHSRRVEQVLPTADGHNVCVGGRTQAFEMVVFATEPRVAAKLLPKQLGNEAGLDCQWRPVRAACLDLVLERWPRMGADLCIGLDEPVYISNHSHYAKLADDGHHVVHALRYDTPGGDTSAGQDSHWTVREGLEHALDRFQPGWRDGTVEARFLPRMPVVHHAPSPTTGGLFGRPSAAPAARSNVYFVGDWVGETGWLSDAVASSAETAAQVLGERLTSLQIRAETG